MLFCRNASPRDANGREIETPSRPGILSPRSACQRQPGPAEKRPHFPQQVSSSCTADTRSPIHRQGKLVRVPEKRIQLDRADVFRSFAMNWNLPYFHFCPLRCRPGTGLRQSSTPCIPHRPMSQKGQHQTPISRRTLRVRIIQPRHTSSLGPHPILYTASCIHRRDAGGDHTLDHAAPCATRLTIPRKNCVVFSAQHGAKPRLLCA